MSKSSPPEDVLRPYVTNLDGPVFALQELPEEVVAVLFAYYSRSPLSLRDNLRKLIEEGDLALQGKPDPGDPDADWLARAAELARRFHEKWVVGYGHASVAEHAVVHLAIEDISIVASKALEDNRLASYTEKSTRYVQFDRDSFVCEPAIAASPLAARYEETCRRLLDTYTRLVPIVEGQVGDLLPRPDDWSERRYRSVCRAKACDILRYLLPAATRTNVGLTVNGRTLEQMLTKLYSSPLGELRKLAEAMHREATAVVPTLVKYAAPNEYRMRTREAIRELGAALLATPDEVTEGGSARLLIAPDDPYTTLAAAILYEESGRPYEAIRRRVAELGRERQLAVIDAYLAGRGRFDAPLRALEHVVYTYEITLDYGAFRDIQRHRMCTQTNQPLTADLGYDTPPEIEQLGHCEAYHEGMRAAAETYRELVDEVGSEAAQYVLPLAYRKRVLFTWNLRELHHFISLRSGKQGHASYRRVAQDCWRELDRVHPELARHIRVDLSAYDLARA